MILEGEIQTRGDINGETFIIPIRGRVTITGALPFSRMKKSVVDWPGGHRIPVS